MRLPKAADYRGGKRISEGAGGGCCLRRLLIWAFLLALIFGATQIYRRREQLGPPLRDTLEGALATGEDWLATQRAPRPTAPPSLSTMARRAEEAWRGGFMEEASEQYALLLETFPGEALLYRRLARAQLSLGRNAEGMASAERAIIADPYAASAWALLSLAHLREEAPAAAIPGALHALFLDDDNAEARAYLAEAYADLGQLERAFVMVEEALARDAENAPALKASGRLHAEANFDLQAAQAELERAYDRAPNLPTYALALAVNQIRLERHEDALGTLLEILDRNPSHGIALYWLGYIHHSVYGDPERASEYLSRCVEVAPAERVCLFYLGRMQKDQLGQYGEAAQHLQRAIALGSEDPRAYYHAADAYRYLGECARALPLLEQGRALAVAQQYELIYENIYLDFDYLAGVCSAAAG